MAEYYHKSHLVVMYPKSDGTPNSALESMAACTPIVVPKLNYDDKIILTKDD